MQNTIFIYSKNLTEQKIKQFESLSNLKAIKQTSFLEYKIAFFRANLTAYLQNFATQIKCDISTLDIHPQLNQTGLLVMDMDSTAIKIECIDEIAKLAGCGELVSSITASAMRGELDFEQSLRKRVATLKNSPESILQKVRQNLPLMEGVEILINQLKKANWKIAIASGGFDYFADYLKQEYQLDATFSNTLEIINNKLTGNILGEVVDANVKAKALQNLANQFNIPENQWVAVGDGANDLPMLKTASLGIALHAKPKVQEQAQFVINFGDLSAIALLLNAKQLFNQN